MLRNKKKALWSIAALLLLILAFAFIYRQFKPAAESGSKAYTLEVVDDTSGSRSYEGHTDAEYLRGLMEELQEKEDFSFAGEESQYGLFLQTVNGVTADYDKDGAYWSILVNGEYGQYGIDTQPVSDGDHFSLIYAR